MAADTVEAEVALEKAMRLYDKFLDKWGEVVRFLRDEKRYEYERIMAYQPFVRDQGMGMTPEDWFKEVGEVISDQEE